MFYDIILTFFLTQLFVIIENNYSVKKLIHHLKRLISAFY